MVMCKIWGVCLSLFDNNTILYNIAYLFIIIRRFFMINNTLYANYFPKSILKGIFKEELVYPEPFHILSFLKIKIWPSMQYQQCFKVNKTWTHLDIGRQFHITQPCLRFTQPHLRGSLTRGVTQKAKTEGLTCEHLSEVCLALASSINTSFSRALSSHNCSKCYSNFSKWTHKIIDLF